MKKALSCLLAVWLAFSLFPAFGEALPEDLPALYQARLLNFAQLLSRPEKGAPAIANLSINSEVDILRVAPDWLLVRAKSGTGYIQRRAVNDTKVSTVDPASTPKYPAVLSSYIGWTSGETPVYDAPDENAEVLTALKAGARLAFISLEDGWARLIYNRQYGFVDTRLLSELLPLFADTARADSSAPIAAYTSFYRTAADEVNLSRMVNIRVGCQRMGALVIQPGERFDFNAQVGPYTRHSGYEPAFVLIDGKSILGYGGGTCQVSSTLYNALMQLPGLFITARRPHGPGGAKYLPLHADAAVGNSSLNLAFINLYDFPVRMDGTAQDGALTIAIYRADN